MDSFITRRRGEAAARRRLSKGGRLFVGTPAVWMEQGAVYGNELERHQSLWTVDEVRAAGLAVHWDGTADAWGSAMLLAVGQSTAHDDS